MSVYEQLGTPMCPKRLTRRLCAEAFGVEEHRLVGASRVREVVIPRHATYFVLRRRFPEMSFPRIGRLMGGRDHSTIIAGIRNIEARMARDEALRVLVGCLVQGRLPLPHDAHVMTWLVARQDARARAASDAIFAARLAEQAALPASDMEYRASIDQTRVHCEQCDRSVRQAEAARCAQRLCALKRAA